MRPVSDTLPLSPGCEYCQAGKWICIFLTYTCQAGCSFCPAPFHDDRIFSDFGDQQESILDIALRMNYKGISFSGGEPFLVLNRLIDWLQFFKTQAPSIYYWVYTNGLEVTEERLKRLADSGLDEIRFNIAAVGYDNPRVLNAIALAADIVPHVAVEIPSIPEDYERLVKVLPFLSSTGVKYLNLHEYIIMNPESALSPQAYKKVRIVDLKDELVCHPRSLANTERVIEFCRRQKFDFAVNNCSMDAKARQMQQRRRMRSRMIQRD